MNSTDQNQPKSQILFHKKSPMQSFIRRTLGATQVAAATSHNNNYGAFTSTTEGDKSWSHNAVEVVGAKASS